MAEMKIRVGNKDWFEWKHSSKEFLSKILGKNRKCDIKRRSLQKEADLHKSHLKFTNKIYNLQENNLRNVQ